MCPVFPTWRDLPAVEDIDPEKRHDTKARAAWEKRIRRVYPAGWFERGGPIVTLRGAGSTRGYEVHLFDHESVPCPDSQAWREKLLTEIAHLVTELAEDGEVGDWESEDQVGIRRWCTLAALVGD